MNNVYLIPHDDGTYEACIQPSAPCESAVVLTAEREYPVEYCYCRLDANGSSVYRSNFCTDRDDLLHALNCDGEALHSIRWLWDFDAYKAKIHDAWTVFNRANDKLMELLLQMDQEIEELGL